MITIVVAGITAAQADLKKAQSQIPFATMNALNSTATIVKGELEREISSVFDRPTRWTLNSLRILYAKKTKLSARVWMKDEADKSGPATKWLLPEIEGGKRDPKHSETRLRDKGLLSDSRYIMPGKDAKLDKHGNLSRGTIRKVVSGLGASFDKLQNSTGSRRSQANKRAFFLLGKGDGALGIGQRTGKRSIRMIIAFGKSPTYSKRLDFYGKGNKVATENIEAEMIKAMRKALATAR